MFIVAENTRSVNIMCIMCINVLIYTYKILELYQYHENYRNVNMSNKLFHEMFLFDNKHVYSM